MESGYSVNPLDDDPDVYAVEMHLNQLRQLGGEVNSAEFRLFVSKRLQWHGICPVRCAAPLTCVVGFLRAEPTPVAGNPG